jgi:hypothetical protein
MYSGALNPRGDPPTLFETFAELVGHLATLRRNLDLAHNQLRIQGRAPSEKVAWTEALSLRELL